MRVFIVDDEPLVLENLNYLLSQFPEIDILLKTTDSQEAFRKAALQKPDVVFVDINMPGLSGLAFAERLYDTNPGTSVVFVTAHDSFAIDAYAYNTLDYILKPVTYEKLRRTLRKIETLHTEAQPPQPGATEKNSFMGFRDNRYYVIAPQDAQYIYVSARKLLLVADGVEYVLKQNINYWSDKLKSQGWLRCHRSYLINLAQIETVMPMSNSVCYVKMKNAKEEIVISRSYILEFKSLFGF